ncbi:hypothetical protein D3C80_1727360 [compost metagenome]
MTSFAERRTNCNQYNGHQHKYCMDYTEKGNVELLPGLCIMLPEKTGYRALCIEQYTGNQLYMGNGSRPVPYSIVGFAEAASFP